MACPQAGGGSNAVVTIGDNSCNFVVSDTYGVPSTDPNGPNDVMNWGQISPCNAIGFNYCNNQASVGNGEMDRATVVTHVGFTIILVLATARTTMTILANAILLSIMLSRRTLRLDRQMWYPKPKAKNR